MAYQKMTKEQIRDLVERYGLACNAMLETNVLDLYQKIYALYLGGQADTVVAVTNELISSDELPEPVRSFWRTGHLAQTSI